MEDEVRVIAERYQLGPTLGKGQFAKVKLGWDVSTTPPTRVALKILRRDTAETDAIANKQAVAEITALQRIAHSNVVRMLDLHPDCLYLRRAGRGHYRVLLIVLELAAGGQLYDVIQYTGRLSERLARSYFQQLVDAVGFCHSLGIAHRDLKPENLLLDAPSFRLKVADFGLSKAAPSLSYPLMRTICGTEKYMAPEVTTGAYDGMLADAWSCGVVLFAMVAGYPPYCDALQSDWWYHQLLKGNHAAFWAQHRRFGVDVSVELERFLTRLLQVHPWQRLAVVDMVNDEWLRGETLTDDGLQHEVGLLHRTVTRQKLLEDGEKKLKRAQEEQQRRAEEELHAPIIGGDDLYRSGGAAAEQQDESKAGETGLPTAAPTMALGTLSRIAMSNGDAAAATASIRLMQQEAQQHEQSEQDSSGLPRQQQQQQQQQQRDAMSRSRRESYQEPHAMLAPAPAPAGGYGAPVGGFSPPAPRLMALTQAAVAPQPVMRARALMSSFAAMGAPRAPAPAAAPAPAPAAAPAPAQALVAAAPVPVYDPQLTVPSMTLLSSALPLRALHLALMTLFLLNHFTVRRRERQHRYKAGIDTPMGSVVINLQLWRRTDSDDSPILLEFRRHAGDSAQYRELLTGLLVQMGNILSTDD